MTGRFNRSRETKRRRKRRWQLLGLLLLALAAGLYWFDRKMSGRPGGHLGEWLPVQAPGRAEHPAAAATAPAGAEPMAGATKGADADTLGAVGLRAEVAAADVAASVAESITQAPPFEAAETGDAPEPRAWQDALAGEAPDATATKGVERGDEATTTEEPATAKKRPNLMPSIASSWVEGDGTNVCPEGFPIKGNANSHIFHRPGESSYEVTIPEICFATEDAAVSAGYRQRKR